MFLKKFSKLTIALALVSYGFGLHAETWGKVEYRTLNGEQVRVAIQRQRSAKTFALMTVSRKGERPRQIGLNEDQFRSLTNWLRDNFLHEQELRNKRKESANCAQKSLGLLIEPGLLYVALCADIARHQALAYRTDRYLNSLLTPRGIASAK